MDFTANLRPAPLVETTHFEDGPVRVTNARLVVDSQSYPIATIASVEHQETPPRRLPGVAIVVIGLLISAYTEFHIAGALLALAGVTWIWRAQGQYSILIRTAAGELRPVTAPDRLFVRAVADALNKVLIGRLS